MKILVPTDFSRLSKIAIQYAIAWSKEFELEVVLLHVMNTGAPTMARLSSKKLEETFKASSEREMNALLEKLKKENNQDLVISSKIVYGSPITKEVEAFALKNEIDMICIGTKGATGLKKMLFGSNAAGIISSSTLPVLTIPEETKYKGLNNIVYSSDLENLEEELKLLAPFAKLMNARVHILHIDDGSRDFDLEGQENELRKLLSYDGITTKVLESDSVIKGINAYVMDVDADMVAMFTRRDALFQKLFKKSVTKKAAFQAKIPLLTFQKE